MFSQSAIDVKSWQAGSATLAGRIGAVDSKIDLLGAELRSEFRAELNPVESDVGALKTDVGVLKTDAAALRTDVAGLRWM